MSEDRLVSITSSSHLVPDDVARHTFGTVRRGFDPGEVRAYLESIALGLRSVGEREAELLRELADAEHRAAHPVLDQATLTDAVGSETARVLLSAHEVAADMEAKAKAEAELLLSEATRQAEESRARTESLVNEQTAAAQAAAEELQERTNQQIAADLESARQEAEALVATAREQCRAMVEEAQELRGRVLADLSKRRKVLHAQIEQLRAGRERLSETVNDVRRSVEAIAQDLFAAEDNARVAAEAAGRAAASRPDDGSPEEMATALLVADVVDETPQDGGATTTDGADAEEATPATDASTGPPAEETTDRPDETDPPVAGEPVVGEDPTAVDELFARLRAERQGVDDAAASTEAPGPGPAPEATDAAPASDGPAEAAPADDPPTTAIRRLCGATSSSHPS
jgi:DivIVA domain-containing protein